MTEQETIICAVCAQAYDIAATHCPHCGETNPLIAEDLLMPEEEEEVVVEPRSWGFSRSGCYIALLFMLFFGLVLGGVILGGYEGLQDLVDKRQAEVEKHYQQALVYADDGNNTLAIAELELALALDPTHTQAREKLETLKATQVSTATPTNPPPSDQTQVEDLYEQAKTLALQGNWDAAIDTLKEIRQVDPGFRPEVISEELYNANYELGLRLISEDDLTAAVAAFDEALVEEPNDPLVTGEWEKATLYLSLKTPEPANLEDNIAVLTRIRDLDPQFADVSAQLYDHYKRYGDYLADQDEWCLAQRRYAEAAQVRNSAEIRNLIAQSEDHCADSQRLAVVPTATSPPTRSNTVTAQATTTTTPTASPPPELSGKIYFSRFNARSRAWEIVAISTADRSETVIITNGAQPSVSSNGKLLVYQSQDGNSIGLHVYDLTAGTDRRVTTFAEDVLPRWNSGNQDFIFNSQRWGDRHWRVMHGFADGKGEPEIVGDGRTPSPSPNGDLIAFQGTDPQGNNPGIYVIPRGGGEPQRLTDGESDRSPAYSPSGERLVYMTAEDGNWDIMVVSARGGTPRTLVGGPTNDALPTWSPDGNQVAFVSDRGGSWGIYVVDAAGGQLRRITNWGDNYPDGWLEQISWGR